jgi:hypothetical protein
MLKKLNDKTIKAKYVGKFEGVRVYESKLLGDYFGNDGYSAVTLPPKGILTGKGVINDIDMMRHEFGHILQYRKYGFGAYYKVIAPESLHSSIINKGKFINGIPLHNFTWTETYANYLSANYFYSINAWIGGNSTSFYWNYNEYPVKNVSFWNFLRLNIP